MPDLLATVAQLSTLGSMINNEESNNSPIDITNATFTARSQNCVDYIEQFTSSVNDVNNGTVFQGDLVITQLGDKCIFNTNAIPNHDFNDGGNAFPNDVSAQSDQFEITVFSNKSQ